MQLRCYRKLLVYLISCSMALGRNRVLGTLEGVRFWAQRLNLNSCSLGWRNACLLLVESMIVSSFGMPLNLDLFCLQLWSAIRVRVWEKTMYTVSAWASECSDLQFQEGSSHFSEIINQFGIWQLTLIVHSYLSRQPWSNILEWTLFTIISMQRLSNAWIEVFQQMIFLRTCQRWHNYYTYFLLQKAITTPNCRYSHLPCSARPIEQPSYQALSALFHPLLQSKPT